MNTRTRVLACVCDVYMHKYVYVVNDDMYSHTSVSFGESVNYITPSNDVIFVSMASHGVNIVRLRQSELMTYIELNTMNEYLIPKKLLSRQCGYSRMENKRGSKSLDLPVSASG